MTPAWISYGSCGFRLKRRGTGQPGAAPRAEAVTALLCKQLFLFCGTKTGILLSVFSLTFPPSLLLSPLPRSGCHPTRTLAHQHPSPAGNSLAVNETALTVGVIDANATTQLQLTRNLLTHPPNPRARTQCLTASHFHPDLPYTRPHTSNCCCCINLS